MLPELKREDDYVTWTMDNLTGQTLRTMLSCGVSIAVLGMGATSAFAQTEGAPVQESAIVVTGSRLMMQTGMDTPVPITAVQAEELEAMDPTSLINSVSQLPQFYGNQTPNNSAFFTRGGTGNLNLRGLGINRTLTLLNGRRMPSSSAFGGVDINVFPEAMIKGIETVTGGASAAYGTDAVAGVVNFLLDTEFEGLQIDGQAGITGRGDGESWEGSIAFGTKLGSRGHLLVSAEYAQQDGIHNYEGRDWYQSWGSVQRNGIWEFHPGVHSMSSSFDGIISAPGTAIDGLKFDRNGNYSPFVPGAITQGAVGGAGPTVGRTVGGDGDDLGAEAFSLWPDTDRYSIFAYADYELADGLKIFGQYIHGFSHQWQYNTPRGSLQGTPTAITIFQDNAFLPDDLRQTMVDNDIASFNLRRMGSIEDIGQAYFEDWTRQNIGTVGFEAEIGGGFMEGWNVQGYYQYGHSRRTWDQYALRVDRIFAAVDAVDDGSGNIVCRVSLDPEGTAAFPGCQPINLFGRGNASAGAIDYVLGNDVGLQINTPLYFANLGFTGENLSYTSIAPKRNITTFEQHFAEVSASGTLFDNWAGPVGLAFGGSWREESVYQVVQDTTNPTSNHDGGFKPVRCNDPSLGLRGVSPADCGNTVGFQYSKVSNIQGNSSVKELFAETLFPLISDQSWMQMASLSAAARWADYSGSGEIWAYKLGLDLAFSDALRLRGTYSRDVRAGNLSERFDKTGGSATVDDPRTPNVTEALNVTIFSGGNPAIRPEKADTFTAGIVFRPDFLPGLSASVDWYRVRMTDAIGQVGTQQVVNNCLGSNLPEFCELVTLDNNVPILVGNLFVNIAESEVEGVDAEISYRSSLNLFGGNETISARMFSAWLINRTDSSQSSGANLAGMTGYRQSDQVAFGYPDFKATGNVTYRNGPFSLFVQGRYIAPGAQDLTPNIEIADNTVDSVFYVDMRLGYELEIAGSRVEIFASATNLFDRDPPITPNYSSFLGYAAQVNPGVYDVLGQRFNLGVKFKL